MGDGEVKSVAGKEGAGESAALVEMDHEEQEDARRDAEDSYLLARNDVRVQPCFSPMPHGRSPVPNGAQQECNSAAVAHATVTFLWQTVIELWFACSLKVTRGLLWNCVRSNLESLFNLSIVPYSFCDSQPGSDRMQS